MNDEGHEFKLNNWQQSALEQVLLENIKEQRSKRHWNIFFRFLYLFIFLLIVFFIFAAQQEPAATGNANKPHTALIKMEGELQSGGDVDSDNMAESLTKAFKNPDVDGIILRISSPGGSPVQASDIYNTIVRLHTSYPDKKIYSVCAEMCASAVYYVASATDQIYANPSSIVGSIGVLLDGFGFVGTLEKLGVERRLITSGSEKGFLDPFSPQKPEDVANAQKMLDIVHDQFINDVKKGRGTRLQDSPDIFTGRAWTGLQAKELGLIDGFGSTYTVAHDVIKNTNIVDYTKKPGLFDTLSRNVGVGFSRTVGKELGLWGSKLR